MITVDVYLQGGQVIRGQAEDMDSALELVRKWTNRDWENGYFALSCETEWIERVSYIAWSDVAAIEHVENRK